MYKRKFPGGLIALRSRPWASVLVATALVSTVLGAALPAMASTPPQAGAAASPPVMTVGTDAASALLTARLQHRRVEVLDARTDSSQTFANPDGSLSYEASADPRRVKRDGVWKDLDTTLQPTASGAFAPAVSESPLLLSGGGAGPLATMTVDGKQVTLTWPTALPRPTAAGATLTYPDVLPSGVDLQVTATAAGGAEETLVVPDATAAADPGLADLVQTVASAGGTTAATDGSGNLTVKNSSGHLLVNSPAPVMWDSATAAAPADTGTGADADAATPAQTQARTAPGTRSSGRDPGTRAHQAAVRASLKDHRLHLAPDRTLLTAKSTVYPVYIDPAFVPHPASGSALHYDEVQSAYPSVSNYDAAPGTGLAVGYQGFSSPTGIERTFYTMSVPTAIYDSTILSAKFNTKVTYAAAGGSNSTTVNAFSTNTISSATDWSNQPAKNTAGNPGYPSPNAAATFTTTSGSPNLAVAFDLTTGMQKIADAHSANWTLGLYNATETNDVDLVRFSATPTFSITYNTKPGAATAVSPLSGAVTNDSTPTLTGKATDANSDTVRLSYEIWTPSGTAALQSGVSSFVNSGANATWTPTTALPSGSYKWRAESYDGSLWNTTWSGWQTFTVDTVVPAATTVSSTAFPANTWSGTPDAGGNFTGSFTFTPPTTDVASVVWQLDDGASTTTPTTGAPFTASLTFKAGKHILYAHTHDAAGNAANGSYTFFAGKADLVSPATGDTTDDDVALSATQSGMFTGVTYQYRIGETDTWKSVPLTDVTLASTGAAVSAWPLAFTASAQPGDLNWAATTTLTDDGPVQVRALFTDSGSNTYGTSPATVTIDRKADNAPSNDIGPGTVNLLTGDYSLAAADASAFGVTVTRSFSSRDPLAGSEQDGQVAIFGPNWVSGITAATTDDSWAYLKQTSATSVALVAADGTQTGFTRSTTGGWTPQTGAENLTLTGALTGTSFTLSSTSGATATFAKVAAGAPTWQIATSYALSGDSATSTTTVSREVTLSDGEILAEPQDVIAPTGAATPTACAAAPATVDCRVLEFVYADSTTATSSAPGDYAGQVKQIRLWATAPGGTASTATPIAGYDYTASGQLADTWDPRLPLLRTGYSYDSAGRVSTLTPPGELPWTLAYGKVGTGGDSGQGMLLSASRPTLAPGSAATTNGTATSSVVYGVPVSGSSAPYALDPASTLTWGQTDNPVTATAVFPATSVPASNDGSTLSSTAYAKADLSYLDKDGLEVNQATPGGHISATGYDAQGNTLQDLTAANRELALGITSSGDPALAARLATATSTADAARLLSMVTTYTTGTDGGETIQDTYGPLHSVTLEKPLTGGADGASLAADSETLARIHTSYRYDEGRPSSAAISGLLTSTTLGASVEGYPTNGDQHTTAQTYDWSTGSQLTTTTDPGGLAVTTTYSYDSDGKQTSETAPTSNGSDAGATVTTYWGASGTGTCQGHPEWAGLVCRSAPAGAITGGGSNPSDLVTKSYTYDRFGEVATVAETANGSTRTTAYTRDDDERITGVGVSGGTGTPTPGTAYTYDTQNGQSVTQTSNGQTISAGYDELGRQISYYDGAGNSTTTAYDALDRPVTVTDSAPSTTSYTYDATTGLGLSVTDSAAGTFTATGRDAAGHLTGETLPGGYALAQTWDSVDEVTNRGYTAPGPVSALSDSAQYTVTGDEVGHTENNGITVNSTYSYDAADRLTKAQDNTGASCTTRGYTFASAASFDRTQLSTATSTADCADTTSGTTTTSTAAHTYDSADRIADTGYSYDAFGRTLTTPGVTLSYYSDDLAQSEATSTAKQSWTLDADHRLATTTTATSTDNGATWTAATTSTNHYADPGDSPTWTATAAGAVTRDVSDLDGALTATTSGGASVLDLSNIHGDIAVQVDVSSAAATAYSYDEFGNTVDPTTRYGWLGASERPSDTPTGLTLMGVRLYDPADGRFLSVDPVDGGGGNAYVYCSADPVDCSDTAGTSDGDGNIGSTTAAERHWCYVPSRARICVIIYDDATHARAVATQIFGTVLGRSYADAFQHIVWMALLYCDVGANTARAEGQRHENFSGNKAVDKKMALTNNDIGISVGNTVKLYGYSRTGTKFAHEILEYSINEACTLAFVQKTSYSAHQKKICNEYV